MTKVSSFNHNTAISDISEDKKYLVMAQQNACVRKEMEQEASGGEAELSPSGVRQHDLPDMSRQTIVRGARETSAGLPGLVQPSRDKSHIKPGHLSTF